MPDLLDRAILIGVGLEKKAREFMDALEEAGRAGAAKPAAGAEGLTPKETLENRIVEDGVKAAKEFLSVLKSVREKLDTELTASSGKVLDRLHVATRDELDVVKEMARVAREKVDRLEKKVEDLERRLG
jgi:BMFP domain-containing protein YqiC